jgi:hypothetical protein
MKKHFEVAKLPINDQGDKRKKEKEKSINLNTSSEKQ